MANPDPDPEAEFAARTAVHDRYRLAINALTPRLTRVGAAPASAEEDDKRDVMVSFANGSAVGTFPAAEVADAARMVREIDEGLKPIRARLAREAVELFQPKS